jgi:hypothetical protein
MNDRRRLLFFHTLLNLEPTDRSTDQPTNRDLRRSQPRQGIPAPSYKPMPSSALADKSGWEITIDQHAAC